MSQTFRLSILILFLFLACLQASAQDSSAKMDAANPVEESTARISEILHNKKFEDTHTLTDSKLRADEGSLSRYSFKSKLTYRGPTVGDPTAADQPNPDHSVGNYSQAIKGTLTSRYRISSDQALSAGGGMVLNHPFHGMDRTDWKDPFVSYDFSYRSGEFQMRSSPGLTVITTPELNQVGETSGLMYESSMVRSFAGTKWGFAMDANAYYYIYNREFRFGKKAAGGDGNAQQSLLQFYPMAKYTFSDRFSFYNGIDMEWFHPRQSHESSTLWAKLAFLRTGLAYASGREFYVTAYLDSYPGSFSTRTTTLNCQTIFSVF